MKRALFDLHDLGGIARASIPWTPVVIVAPERQFRQNLVRRTSAVHEGDLYDSYMSAVEVARAARAVYFARAAARIYGVINAAISGTVRRLLASPGKPVLRAARR